MGIMPYSLLWVMQDLYDQLYDLGGTFAFFVFLSASG